MSSVWDVNTQRILHLSAQLEGVLDNYIKPTIDEKNALEAMPGFAYFEHYALFVIIGLLLFFAIAGKSERFSPTALAKYFFPPDIYRHRSFRTDCVLLVVNEGFFYVLSLFINMAAAEAVEASLFKHFGNSPLALTNGGVSVALLFIILFVTQDFSVYFIHFLQHKVPALWRLHRVHHSAEVLTPLTGLTRRHPLDAMVEFYGGSLLRGWLAGGLLYLCGLKMNATAVAALGLINLLHAAWQPFQHSHLWFSFGKLNRFFLSPCMHLVHHSALLMHRDKNLGSVLTVWDYLFGTLYAPRAREVFPLGISMDERGANNPHNSIVGVLIEPVTTLVQTLRGMESQPHTIVLGEPLTLMCDGSKGQWQEPSGASARQALG